MTEKEKEKVVKESLRLFVLAGGLLTLAYAIYFIVDLVKNWYS